MIVDIEEEDNDMAKKSLFVTYFLWLLFGWLGLHHFYLGRDRHAFIWWSTFGGIFFLGWFRDIWRIPEYVEDANEELDYMETLTRRMKLRKEPPFNVSRFAGEMMVGYFYGILVRLAIPEEAPAWLVGILVPFGIAVGVHLVGNVGREKGEFKYPFMASITGYFLLSYLTGEEASYMYCALFASCAFNYYRKYRRTPKPKAGTCHRLVHLGLSGCIIISLWCSFMYFNANVTTEDGEKIKLRDAVNHFFTSPAWLEFKETVWQLFEEGQKQGWKNMYDEFVKALDPRGEQNALKVLGLPENATESEIRRRYKKLAVKWHPDRNKDNQEEAQKKFIEIQQAYEVLSKLKSQRTAQNEKPRQEDRRTEF